MLINLDVTVNSTKNVKPLIRQIKYEKQSKIFFKFLIAINFWPTENPCLTNVTLQYSSAGFQNIH